MRLSLITLFLAILIANQVLAQRYKTMDDEDDDDSDGYKSKRYPSKSKYRDDEDSDEDDYKPAKPKYDKRKNSYKKEEKYEAEDDDRMDKKKKGSYERYKGKKEKNEEYPSREKSYDKKKKTPSYKRPSPKKECNSCSSLLEYTLLTMILSCRDRVATKYYDLVQVPEVIVKLLTPEMDICLNGPVSAEANPDTYPGTNDTLVMGFVDAFKNPSCRSALNRTVLLTFSEGQVDMVKPILKEDLPHYHLERVSQKCGSIVLKSIDSCDANYKKN